MERLLCKTCGCESLMPVDVVTADDEEVEQLLASDQESRFYSCHVCGDNWLSIKEVTPDGSCTITFIHQMGMDPTLKRTAVMQTPVVIRPNTVDAWHYYMDDAEIDEDVWRDKLKERRRLLKSICTN